MADYKEVTPEMEAQYQNYLGTDDWEPECREVAAKIRPWKLYWLPDPGQRVCIHSVDFNGPNSPVTVTVAVLGKYNLVAIETLVFGIDPAKLTECDLPPPGDPVGVIHDTPEGRLAYINHRRRLNGVEPVSMTEMDSWTEPGRPTEH